MGGVVGVLEPERRGCWSRASDMHGDVQYCNRKITCDGWGVMHPVVLLVMLFVRCPKFQFVLLATALFLQIKNSLTALEK